MVYAGARDLYVWDEASEQWTRVAAGLSAPPDCTIIISALLPSSHGLYVGGNPRDCSGEHPDPSVNAVARWDGTEWSPLGSGIAGAVYAMALHGDDLYVGGAFHRAGGQPSLNFARWNATLNLPAEQEELPAPLALRQNYPNPFTTSTTITYVLERPARRVVLQVFDALGRAVATLVDGPASAGVHDVPFDAAGLAGRVYFIRLGGDAGAVSQTMVLVR